jgi:hypothetical protein
MKIEFPKVLHAAQAKEGATWKLADAAFAAGERLVADDTPSARYDRMAAELTKHVGRDYDAYRLARYASVAAAFPPSRRKKGVSFEVCLEARTPENLATITRAAQASDRERPISKRLVRRIMSHSKRDAGAPTKAGMQLTDADVQGFFLSADIMGDFKSILTKLYEVEARLTPEVVAELSEAMVGAYAEDCEKGKTLFQSIRSKLRGKKGHLAVVA